MNTHGVSIRTSAPTTKKPPIGLRPKSVVARDRVVEILDAMKRYVEAGKGVPDDWREELDGWLDEEGLWE